MADEKQIATPSTTVSTATWEERWWAEFERLGGPGMPATADMAGLPRAEAAGRAKDHADHSVMGEMHAMLRYLCERLA